LNKQLKFIVLIIFIFVCFIISGVIFKNVSAEQLRDYIDYYGVWAPIIYIILFTLLPIVFFPVAVLALAAGLLFGFWEGTFYTMIGAIMNSSLMFFMAKVLARQSVMSFLHKHLSAERSKLLLEVDPQRGFWFIFTLRLIPLVPYNLINYGAGLTAIRFRDYTTATALGILPGTLVFLNIGDKVVDVHDPRFLVAVILLVILIVISLLLAKKITPDRLEGKKDGEQKKMADIE